MPRREERAACLQTVPDHIVGGVREDHRVWSFEEGLWTGDTDHYKAAIDDECLMALPAAPFVMTGKQAIDAVSHTPRWSNVALSDRQIMRPQEGLIVVAYRASAKIRRILHFNLPAPFARKLEFVQHQQTPPPVAKD